MGVVNVTPDSFSDGGQHQSTELAISHALTLESQGAQILDVGGESTRPGATPVSEQEELDRVIPVIEGVRARSACPISIDTSKARVMSEAIAAGANLVNDVQALQGPSALETAAQLGVPVVLMHMQGTPSHMQVQPTYEHVVDEIQQFLLHRIEVAQSVGLSPNYVVIDPGFGFGKTLDHNLALLAELDGLVALGYPVLAGISRKSMLGALTGRKDPKERVSASVAASLLAAKAGAAIVRVHDVAETCDALKILAAVEAHRVDGLKDKGDHV